MNRMRLETRNKVRWLVVVARTAAGVDHTYQVMCGRAHDRDTPDRIRTAMAFWIQRLWESYHTGTYPIYQERTASEWAWLEESRRRMNAQRTIPRDEYTRLLAEWEEAEYGATDTGATGVGEGVPPASPRQGTGEGVPPA